MKISKLLVIATLLVPFAFAQAEDDVWDAVAPSIVGEWDGYWENGNSYGETFEVKVSPRSYVETKHRQVGSENTPDVPYPTVCKYRQYANPKIEKCTTEDLQPNGYCNYGNEPSKYIFSYEVTKVELINDPQNDTACPEFIKQQEDYINSGGLNYSFPFHLNSDGDLIQYGDDVYKRK